MFSLPSAFRMMRPETQKLGKCADFSCDISIPIIRAVVHSLLHDGSIKQHLNLLKVLDLAKAARDVIASVLFFWIAEDILRFVVLHQVAHLTALISCHRIKKCRAI